MTARSRSAEAFRCAQCKAEGPGIVTDSRPTGDGTAIRRRRKCLTCGTRHTTYEIRAHELEATRKLPKDAVQYRSKPSSSGPIRG